MRIIVTNIVTLNDRWCIPCSQTIFQADDRVCHNSVLLSELNNHCLLFCVIVLRFYYKILKHFPNVLNFIFYTIWHMCLQWTNQMEIILTHLWSTHYNRSLMQFAYPQKDCDLNKNIFTSATASATRYKHMICISLTASIVEVRWHNPL